MFFSKVADLYVHEDYDPKKKLNDIALVYLSRDAVINKFVRPICLSPNKEALKTHLRSGLKGYVSGWGLTESSINAERLLTAKVNVFKDSECLKALRTVGKFCLCEINVARFYKLIFLISAEG